MHLAIQTILNQTRRPDLTVLYLATEEFPRKEDDLPRELLALRSDRFEIRWTKNIRSYKKLIPALKDFPDDIIVTFDDDLIYPNVLIERLLVGYKEHPLSATPRNDSSAQDNERFLRRGGQRQDFAHTLQSPDLPE